MTRSNVQLGGQELKLDADGDTSIQVSTDDVLVVDTAGSERARIDSSGMLIGKTDFDNSTAGIRLNSSGDASFVKDGARPLVLNRKSSDGEVVLLLKDGTTKGSIGINGSGLEIDGHTSANANMLFGGTSLFFPSVDNVSDVGANTNRFDDVFATNGTIQTSDQNEKQDIASATAKELNVAKKLSALFKTFKWKDKVVEKGDKARTHTGIIAQDIQSAFSAEGLDASNYGLFISDTWTNDDGKEQTRLGVRYPELFSFIFSSIEARLTTLESK
jgi:hypothetical protein